MQAKEIRELSPADITAQIAALQEEQFRLKFRSATEHPPGATPAFRVIRRDIARLNDHPARAASAERRALAGSDYQYE